MPDSTGPEVTLRLAVALEKPLAPGTPVSFEGVGEAFRVEPLCSFFEWTRRRTIFVQESIAGAGPNRRCAVNPLNALDHSRKACQRRTSHPGIGTHGSGARSKTGKTTSLDDTGETAGKATGEQEQAEEWLTNNPMKHPSSTRRYA